MDLMPRRTGYVLPELRPRPGIGSRLTSLGQAVWLARELDRAVIVDWRRTLFFENRLRNYFTEFFEPVPTICGVPMHYPRSRKTRKYEWAKRRDRPWLDAALCAQLAADPASAPPYLVVRAQVDLEPFPAYDKAKYAAFLEDVYRQIVPRRELAREVDEWYDANLRGHFVVGVNIATGNGLFDPGGRYPGRVDVGMWDDPGRFLHAIEEGFARATRLLPASVREAAKIFVATDSGEMSELLCSLSPAVTRRTVFPPPGTGHHFTGWAELDYSERRAAADVLIDMLLLARCDALIMTLSRFTSYALVSTRYFNGNVQKLVDLHRELAVP
jgi:Nodulation protein Z (NodZ)